jgi:hypothetical protein
MACTKNHQDWTIHMANDKKPVPPDTLKFCLKTDLAVVTGTVSDKNGAPLSTDTRVKGIRLPIPTLGLRNADGETVTDLLSLSFRWDKSAENIRIQTMGTISIDAGGTVKFQGRFLAYSELLESMDDSRILAGPDTGDTGTGSGTQT